MVHVEELYGENVYERQKGVGGDTVGHRIKLDVQNSR